MAPVGTGRHTPFKAKLDIALRLMESRGMWRSNYAPDIYRFLWFFGARIRPPHFARPIACAAFHTLEAYAISWMLLILARWLDYSLPVAILTIGAPVAGPIFGVLIAVYYRCNARRHGLPHW
jgi:hypothetical protein